MMVNLWPKSCVDEEDIFSEITNTSEEDEEKEEL